MKKLSRIAAAIIAVVMTFSLAGCKLISKTEEGEKNTVVAKANGKKITKGEFEKSLAVKKVLLGAYYGYDFFDGESGAGYLSYIKTDTLNEAVQEQVIKDKAKKLGLIDDEEAIAEEAKKQLDEYTEALSDKNGFDNAIEKNGITTEDILDYFRNSVIHQRLFDETTKDVTVADDEIKKYYDENPYEFTEKENVMNLSHILVDSSEEALSVKNRLKAGENFEDVAKEVSKDDGTKDKGGLLGDVKYVGSNYIQEFVDAAIKLKEGDISDPVQTTYGWHIIKCNSKTEYPEKAFDDVKDSIKEDLLSDKKNDAFSTAYKEWNTAAKVKTYTDRI